MGTPTAAGEAKDRTFRTQRVLAHPPQRVFDAFARAEILARWWGPTGFTNVFDTFEFKQGGAWKYVMHAPGGTHHPNESVFQEIEAPSRVVIRHVSKPTYTLTVTLSAEGEGTAITWSQEFDDGAVAARIKHIVEPANEQNLDRLQAVLAEGAKGSA
jgi:uncharacterized protein YndB with AHSA1/START domain